MKKMLNKAVALIAALSMTVGISALAAPTDEIDAVQDEVITGTLTDGTVSDDIFFGEDEAPEGIGDEPGVADTLPDEVLISEEAQAGIEELKKLEFNAANVRYAIYALEAENLIWPADYSDEELEQMFEGATMEIVVDQILEVKSNAGVSTLSLKDNDYINVSASNIDSQNTYIVLYGEETKDDGSITYDTSDNKDLIIKPKSGYKISSISIITGYFEEASGKQGNIMDYLDSYTGIFKLPASVLSDNTGVSPWGGGRRDNNFAISITTTKADAGKFTISETIDNGDALYSVSGVYNASDLKAKALMNGLNGAIDNKTLQVGNILTFTVDPSKISGVKVNNDEVELTNNTFDIEVSEKVTNIEFVYKSKVTNFELNGDIKTDNFSRYISNVTCTIYVNNVAGTTVEFTSLEELQKYIKTRYIGESIRLTFAFTNESNAAIDSASLNESPMSISGTSIGPAALEETNTLNLTLKDITPIVQTSVQAVNGSQIIVGQITNYNYLNSSAFEKITNTGFNYSVTNTTNPAKDKYTSQNVTADRKGDTWAMKFVQKKEEGFQHSYTFDVSATALYDSTRITGNAVEVNVGAAN